MTTGVVTGIVYRASDKVSETIYKISIERNWSPAGAVVGVVLLPLNYGLVQPTLNNEVIC